MGYREENAISQLEFLAGNISVWEDRALALKAASDIIYLELVAKNKKIEEHLEKGTDNDYLIYPTSGLNLVWGLSAGYSMECLIKGIIIATTTEPILTSDNKFNMKVWGNEKRSHDLYYLLTRKVDESYKPTFTADQVSFILKIQSYTIWRGKYPIPIEPMDQVRYLGPDSEKMYVDLGAFKLKNNRDKTYFDEIFSSLNAKLQEAKEHKVKKDA